MKLWIKLNPNKDPSYTISAFICQKLSLFEYCFTTKDDALLSGNGNYHWMVKSVNTDESGISSIAEINSDSKIGLEKAVYILHEISTP
jgi:hypothetical protein